MSTTQSYEFAQQVKTCQAFNMPTGVKKVWSNQYGNGYIFPDDSYLKVFNSSSNWELFWGSVTAYSSRHGVGLCASMLLTRKALQLRKEAIA